MKRSRLGLATLMVAALGIGAGLSLQAWLGSEAPSPASTKRPDFSLAEPDGTPRDIAEWNGRVMLVNFWATWCAPCRREIPLLIELQDELGERGLQVIGIAIDEAAKVAEFTDRYRLNYPVLVGEAEAARISERFGNELGVLPFTAFVDVNGRIVDRHRGEITRELAERIIEPLL